MLVESAADIVDALGWAAPRPKGDPRPGLPRAVVEAFRLPAEVVDFSVDDAVHASGLSAPAVLARLLAFEVDGVLRRVGAGRFAGARANVTRSGR